jgi:predicted metalloprotease with PDZ domain
MRASKESFDARMAEKRPDDLITLTIFRSDDLSTLPIKLGGRIDAPYKIVPLENPTEEQERIYQSWLHSPLKK